jgi:hypothetical protein
MTIIGIAEPEEVTPPTALRVPASIKAASVAIIVFFIFFITSRITAFVAVSRPISYINYLVNTNGKT